MSNIQCPINFKKIDQNVIRIVTLYYFIILLSSYYFDNIYILLIFYIDILGMFIFGHEKAFLYNLIKVINKKLSIKKDMVDSGPKKFAFGMGLFMGTILLLFGHFFGYENVKLMITVKMMFFTFLETSINFCMGCFIYKLLVKTKLIKQN